MSKRNQNKKKNTMKVKPSSQTKSSLLKLDLLKIAVMTTQLAYKKKL